MFFKGDGATSSFTFSFRYLQKKFVKVRTIDGATNKELTYGVDYTVEETRVILKTPPAAGLTLCIYRETPTNSEVEWADGSTLRAYDMNKFEVQLLHLAEESMDKILTDSLSFNYATNTWEGSSHIMSNIADPVSAQDVVTKHYMESVQDGFVQQNSTLANAAAASAANAKTCETNSATSASASASSASNAKVSETNAKTSETNAKASETAAKTSETNAKASEVNAKASETNAKASEVNAKASEVTSKSSETNAKASETASAASAVNAKTSETNAKASETNAAGYAAHVSHAFCYRGSVDTYSALPTSPMIGDTYNILTADTANFIAAGDNVVWSGTSWDNLSGITDLSAYSTTAQMNAKFASYSTTAQMNAAIAAYVPAKATTANNIPTSDVGGNIWIA